MEDFERLDRTAVRRRRWSEMRRPPPAARPDSGGRDRCARMLVAPMARRSRTSRPSIRRKPGRGRRRRPGIDEARGAEQRSERRRLDSRVDMRGAAFRAAGRRRAWQAQLRQRVATGHRADEQSVAGQSGANARQGAGQVVDRVERADRDGTDRRRSPPARNRPRRLSRCRRLGRSTARIARPRPGPPTPPAAPANRRRDSRSAGPTESGAGSAPSRSRQSSNARS